VLPTAKQIAARVELESGIFISHAPSAAEVAVSGASAPAAVASHSLPVSLDMEARPTTPSARRQAMANSERSGSTSRVIAYSVTASARAQKQPTSSSTIPRRMAGACSAIPASFAAVPSPLAARLVRIMPLKAAAM
jgi:hypothetical protein